MKTFFYCCILFIIVCPSCKKDDPARINCDGLVTDTTGTNDTARIYMATAFSPDNNGINDLLRPVLKSVAAFDFKLYDELNNVVYSTNQFLAGYSPAAAPAAYIKYYYRIQTTTLEGHQLSECGEVYNLSCLPGGIQANSLHLEDQLTNGGYTEPSNDPVLQINCP